MDDRIALFLEQAEVLRSSTAVPKIDETSLTFQGTEGGGLDATLNAPDDEATIAYFARIREFDTPGKAIYVADFFQSLESAADWRRSQVVDFLRRAHADLGREMYDRPNLVLGPGATPRAVWELWTYAHLIHVDVAKRTKWAALDEYQMAFAKFVSYVYAGDLYHLVTVVEAMLRDQCLDDRGVRMQILTIDPRYKGTAIPPFEAAKVRLA